MPKDVYVSVMAQYFPTFKAKEMVEINRKINLKEYNRYTYRSYLYALDLEK